MAYDIKTKKEELMFFFLARKPLSEKTNIIIIF
jgi:hypothetical protein